MLLVVSCAYGFGRQPPTRYIFPEACTGFYAALPATCPRHPTIIPLFYIRDACLFLRLLRTISRLYCSYHRALTALHSCYFSLSWVAECPYLLMTLFSFYSSLAIPVVLTLFSFYSSLAIPVVRYHLWKSLKGVFTYHNEKCSLNTLLLSVI